MKTAMIQKGEAVCMTMVAACRFQDGAVIIADSRATWLGNNVRLFEDALQKILPLGRRTAICYAGDVAAAELLVHQLRLRIGRKKRLGTLPKLAAEMPRIARHYHKLRNPSSPLALILGGTTEAGNVQIWHFQSPLFEKRELLHNSPFVVIGSGKVVESYIRDSYPYICRELPNLKSRADHLLVGLEEELQQKGDATVGGLLQAILIEHNGISPLRHGFTDLNPTNPGRSMEMDMQKGRWIQRDLISGLKISLKEPVEIVQGISKNLRVHDFDPPREPSSGYDWHLTHFLTCSDVSKDVGTVQFRGVFSIAASTRYPLKVRFLASVGLWGSAGQHELKFYMVRDGAKNLVRVEAIHIEHFPEEVEKIVKVQLEIVGPGPVFLECFIGEQLLGRRALYFGEVSETQPSDKEKFIEFGERQANQMIEKQRACLDPLLEESKKSTLVYMSACQNCIAQGTFLKFEGQMFVAYWKSYPLKLPIFLATAFRMPVGKHCVRVDLMNASTRKTLPVATSTVQSNSSCIIISMHSEAVVTVPEPGYYFLNAYVDNELVGTSLLIAETDQPRFSYSLLPDECEKIRRGELLILLKRSLPSKPRNP